MSIFIFVATIIISYLVVKIGAAAFELTGLDPEQGHFQALSAFTGTGFTTRESELIVVHRQRRKIASILIILGNAGLVTLIASLVNTIRPDTQETKVFIPTLKNIPAIYTPYINLLFCPFCTIFSIPPLQQQQISKDINAKGPGEADMQ